MTTVRGMGTMAAKYWWVLLVRGILLVLLGIAMFAWPKATLLVFVVLFAAYLFVDGIMTIFQGFSERKAGQPSGWSFISGALAIAFGIAVLVWPDAIGKVDRLHHRDLGDPRRRSPASPPGSGSGRHPDPAGAGSWPGASWPASSASRCSSTRPPGS